MKKIKNIIKAIILSRQRFDAYAERVLCRLEDKYGMN